MIKADLLRACAVFVAVFLFGCAIYVLALRLNGAGLLDTSSGLSAGPNTNTVSGQNREDALSMTPTQGAEVKPEPGELNERDRSNDGEQLVEATPEVAQTERAPSSQTDSESAQEPVPTFRQPVAFAEDEPNPAASPEEIAELNTLRQEFIEEVGGYDQDPSDPKYQERWQAAQQLFDEKVRSQLGEEVFSRLQNEGVSGTTSEVPQE